MANIMSQLKLKNNTSRNAFDISRKNAFTAKVGELLPVACIECIPGDKIKGYVQHFTRTTPVNTAAYTRIREYYDWFFVPTNLLWNKFNTFVTQMTDNNQHATGITSSQVLTSQHPYFTCNQVASYLSSQVDNNMFGFARNKLSAKLMEYLGYGDFYDSTSGTAQSFRQNAVLNPFPLLAYQKIYQDFFRNSQWENAYAPAFNIDYISGSADSLNIPLSSLLGQTAQTTENMFDLRYANWNKDLFMGVLPNSQYGDEASIILGGSTTGTTSGYQPVDDLQIIGKSSFAVSGMNSNVLSPGYVKNASNPEGQLVTIVDGQYSTPATDFLFKIPYNSIQKIAVGLGLNPNSNLNSSFSILALRQAEALQKWKEITQSQQQDYKNQIEAHFGVSMSDAYSERCKYIDGSVSSLDISEVTNTNITSDNSADIAGKGVGVGDSSINFSSDVHGYLMCIYHAVPLLDYSKNGINRMNLKSFVTDYAIPEFDKTGMVQVPMIELTNDPLVTALSDTNLIGYAPRYYDYKTAVDEVHGAFKNGGLGAWVAPVDNSYIRNYFSSVNLDSVGYEWFKVNPSVLNPIFTQNVDSDNTTDQLLVNCSLDLTAVRNLDRNGLPY